MAACALGLALVGPQVAGTAAADADTAGSVSADPAHPGAGGGRDGGDRTARTGETRAGAATGRAPDDAVSARTPRATTSRQPLPKIPFADRNIAPDKIAPAEKIEDRDEISPRRATRFGPERTARSGLSPDPDSAIPGARRVSPAPRRAVAVPRPDTGPAPDTHAAAAPVSVGSDPQFTSTPAAQAAQAAQAIVSSGRVLAAASSPVSGASAAGDIFSTLFGPIQAFAEGVALLIRRTFFNRAPTVNPVQTTGQITGSITGTLGAEDPEGDPLTYDVIEAPRYGAVVIGTDGSFVYTPGADFTGRDGFNVAVTDIGFRLNLLDPFRPASTEAYTQVAQDAMAALLTFSFAYRTGSQYWTAEARDALEDSAERLAAYIVVTRPTVLAYDIIAENSPSEGTLASASSELSSTGIGFFPTVVQEKILTGIDSNGSTADGEIYFNFGNPWSFGTVVDDSQYDFTSTAMHEVLHTFGFLSYTDEAGYNTGREWPTFDQFMITSDGTPVISDTYRFDTAYNRNLTGRDGGLYFGGPNAVAAYGGYVPLYTPRPWEPGSSTSHLDDDTFTGSDLQLMNALADTGLGIRVLGPIELGILRDLGYTVNDFPAYAFVFFGLGFLGRRVRARV